MAETLSVGAANAAANAVCALLDGGYLRLYDGVRPESADQPVNGQQMIAELRFSRPAFRFPAAGVAVANAITHAGEPVTGGIVTWFRAVARDGKTVILDGDAGVGAADLVLSTPVLLPAARVFIDSFTYTQKRS